MAAPIRTCIACGRKGEKPEFLRIARKPDGDVAIDAEGRSAYFCPDRACIEKAFRGGLLKHRLRLAGNLKPETIAHLLESLNSKLQTPTYA